jgi:hypothetical protein
VEHHFPAFPHNKEYENVVSNLVWLTWSKALVRSQNIPSAVILLFKTLCIPHVSFYVSPTVGQNFLKESLH